MSIPTFKVYKNGKSVNVDEFCCKVWFDNGWTKEGGGVVADAPKEDNVEVVIEGVTGVVKSTLGDIFTRSRTMRELKAIGVKKPQDFLDADIEDLINVYGINRENIDEYIAEVEALISGD